VPTILALLGALIEFRAALVAGILYAIAWQCEFAVLDVVFLGLLAFLLPKIVCCSMLLVLVNSA